jgi:hypothetical protein
MSLDPYDFDEQPIRRHQQRSYPQPIRSNEQWYNASDTQSRGPNVARKPVGNPQDNLFSPGYGPSQR